MNTNKKRIKYELDKIEIPRGLGTRIAEIMGISKQSVSNIANCHTYSILQRDKLIKAIEIAKQEAIDKIGK
jgi:predicted XRE-type DNA-binding protein